MCLPVIDEPDAEIACEGDAIDLYGRHSPRHTSRVLDDEIIPRGAIAAHQLEDAPRARDTWVYHELRAAEPKPEDRLEPGAIHPPR